MTRLCMVDGCSKPAKPRQHICSMHCARRLRHGSFDGLSPVLIAPPGTSTMRRLLLGVISDDDCWIWGRNRSSTGYGHLGVNGRTRGVHVLMWEQINQAAVPKGAMVCHACDVRACINPNHLWLGDARSNGQDMARKGRSARASARVSPDQVRTIRQLRASMRAEEVASQFGIAVRTVYNIWARKTWRDVEDEGGIAS